MCWPTVNDIEIPAYWHCYLGAVQEHHHDRAHAGFTQRSRCRCILLEVLKKHVVSLGVSGAPEQYQSLHYRTS